MLQAQIDGRFLKMISWEQIDARLAALGRDRTWLAEHTPYTYDTIRNAMAPKSTRKTERMLVVLSRAIEDEEARQRPSGPREIRPGVFDIFQTDEQLHTADVASRIVKSPSLVDFCRDTILAESERILADEAAGKLEIRPVETGYGD